MTEAQNQLIFIALMRLEFTYRQYEIVKFTLKAITLKEVGAALFIEESSVKEHLRLIYKKLGVKNKANLFLWAIKVITGGDE